MGELVIRIDPETAERLNRVAAEGQGSAEEIALAAVMDRLEELEDAPVAWSRIRELEDGSVQAVPHEQAMRDLGLAD